MSALATLAIQFSDLPPGYEALLERAAAFAVTFLVVYLLGRYVVVPSVTRIVGSRNRNNPTIRDAVGRYVHVLVLFAAVVAAVVAAGYGGVLTRSAVVVAALTLVFGVAGQELFAALISGLFLVADPKFNVGDWIAWNGTEGVVESISLRVTRVRTRNNEIVTVPNTELTGSAITRPYGKEQFRITERVQIAYDEDVDEALRMLREAAAASDAVLADPAPRAYFVEFGETTATLESEFWLSAETHHNVLRVRSDYARRVKRRFEAADVRLGPPLSVSLENAGETTR